MSSLNKAIMMGLATSGFQKITKATQNQNSKKQALTNTAYGRIQQRWVPKEQKGKTNIEQRKEGPSQSNKLTTTVKKATAQEKGKWVPKMANKTAINYKE